jgi:hypothetical protein
MASSRSPHVSDNPSIPFLSGSSTPAREDHELIDCVSPSFAVDQTPARPRALRHETCISEDTHPDVHQQGSVNGSDSVSHSPTGTTWREPDWKQKLGITAICVLTIGNIVIVTALILLGFLWFGNKSNLTWHSVVVRDWLPKAITIISKAMEVAVGVQIGTCSAMLAALALERFEVQLESSAPVAMAKMDVLASGAILGLVQSQWRSWKSTGFFKSCLPHLTIAFAVIYGFTQAITLILVSDLALSQVPGLPQNPYYIKAQLFEPPEIRLNAWLRKPQLYPTFAEYSEEPFQAPGVSDTGVTLRAFLPYAAATDRESVQEYIGETTVLDSRVTCQIPHLKEPVLGISHPMNDFFTLNGSFAASRTTPRWGNFANFVTTENHTYNVNVPVPFSCTVPATGRYKGQNSMIALCQLGEGGRLYHGTDTLLTISGGLISEFQSPSTYPSESAPISPLGNSNIIGTAYLALNMTLVDPSVFIHLNGEIHDIQSTPSYSERGEWLDLTYSNSSTSNSSVVLSVSLCYSAFNHAQIPVKISSQSNRTEPVATFGNAKSFVDFGYQFDAIRQQLGQYRNHQTNKERGVLDLKSQNGSWIAKGGLSVSEPALRQSADISGPSPAGNSGNVTAILWDTQACSSTLSNPLSFDSAAKNPYVCPEPMHVRFFQEILKTGGSLAFGLQSLITIFSSMAYYERTAELLPVYYVKQTFFVTANTAQHHKGLFSVVIIMIIHVTLVTLVSCMFLKQTRYAMLGNTWQNIAQIITTPKTKRYLDMASMMSDGDVRKFMREQGEAGSRVGIKLIGEEDGIGLVGLEGYEFAEKENTKLLPRILPKQADGNY